VTDRGGGLHDEVLPAVQQRVLRQIGPAAEARGFHLAGGTALAMQLGHRRSVDFDWFRDAPLSDPHALARELDIEVTSTSADTLHGRLEGVQLSFFSYRYPLLGPLVEVAGDGCRLASLADLAAMKLSAITQRGTRKDYYDVVALGSVGLDLGRMLEAYREKFSVSDVGHVLVSLTWFDDADKDPEPVLAAREEWSDVKDTLRAWVRDLARP